MDCTNCGSQNPEGSTFCTCCGLALNKEKSANLESIPCSSCGVPVDRDAIFCEHCGSSIHPVPGEPTSEPTHGEAKHKTVGIKKTLIVIGFAVAALLLVFIIIGLCTNWFGLNGPITQIGTAAVRTFNKNNLSADFELQIENKTIDGTLLYDMDVKEEIIHMYMDINNGKSKYILAIYDDKFIYGKEDKLSCKDASYFISALCDSVEDGKKSTVTFNEAWDRLIDMIPNQQQQEINDEYVNLKTLKKLVKSFFTGKLNNSNWLKENAGYSTTKSNGVKIHTFEPEITEFLSASADHFETAFVKASVYDDLMDWIDDTENFSDKTDIYTGFGIKGGKLVLIEVEITYEDFTFGAKCEFYDIGKTEIDEDLLDDLLDEAEMNS